MKTLPLTPSILLLAMLLLPAPPARAAERTVLNLKFERQVYSFEPAGANAPPTVSQDETGTQCKLVSNLPDDDMETLPVWTVTKPPLGRGPFSIVGTVAYRNVRTQARLEIDVEYPDGTHDRVGVDAQKMVQLNGTSAGRPFRLDYPGQPDATPRTLTLCVTIQGKGVVTISDAKLVVPAPPATAPAAARPPSPPLSSVASRGMTADAAMAAMLDDQLANNLMGPTRLKQARDEMAEGLKVLREEARGDTPDDRERVRLKELILAAYDRRLAAVDGKPGGGPKFFDQTAPPPASMPMPGLASQQDLVRRMTERRGPPRRNSREGAGDDAASIDPTTSPAVGVPLRDLPPAVAVKLRKEMEDTLVQALVRRHSVSDELNVKVQQVGAGHPTVGGLRLLLQNLDLEIAELRQLLAEPLQSTPATAAALPPTTADGWRNLSLSDRAYWSFSQFLVCHVGVVFGGALMWVFVRQGHFRRLATVYFAIVIVCGLAEIFMAGFAVGKDRPAEVAIVFLCGALVMIGGPVLLLPHLNRVHADVELRKLRAMDVA